jgi:hypothetical protein
MQRDTSTLAPGPCGKRGFVVVLELLEDLGTSHGPALGEEPVDGLPQRHPAGGCGLVQSLHLLPIGTQGQAKHVGNHFLAEPLALELANQAEEHLVSNVRQRRTNTICRRQLGDEDHRLADDSVDQ